ncbi:fimbria/pilus chaperone family protein [Pantoea agglomerans]|uniref:P pilus assembly chaperone PapD n=1 Tax=Enterobacter agglomerans TaxID=549 RepID=A0ABD6XRB9_ENTAG|nr:fimbria/pilus chaperone family protein [Pantoea agglomerans]WNK35837.1 fimbria/pilus chaperone family protein [Pantoea agglomerans]WNK72045.1 fimbria/pilus chaperone family protein [Pantoea agglomerans]
MIKSLSLAILFSLSASVTFAAGMRPEVPVLFIDDQNREVTINVLNTDNSTALLHSRLQTIPEDPENKLIITPQLVRVEGGKKQQIRVVLKDGVKLDKQKMQRIDFVSIPQDDGKKNRARILIGQNIPVILSPADLPLNTTPWTGLTFHRTGSSLSVENPTPYIVRLTKQVDLLPGKQSVELKKSYILPGEKFNVPLPAGSADNVKSVRLHPVTRYGILTAPFDAQL